VTVGVKDLLDRLTAEDESAVNGCDGKVYDLVGIRATARRCIDLTGSGLLAVDDGVDHHVSFAVFRFHSGPSTRNGVIVDGEKMSVVFHGSGPSGALRELRHTYWGENGYIFYPHGALIASAFAALKEWFDCD